MKGQRKTPKSPGKLRHHVAANIRHQMRAKFWNATNQPLSLAKAAGLSLSTVQRILSAEVGASIDNLEHIAQALDVPAFRLLLIDSTPHRPAHAPRAQATLHEPDVEYEKLRSR